MFPLPFNFPFRKKDGSLTTIANAISEGGGSYTLPTASANVKGGIKVGDGLTMDGEVLKNLNPTPATPYTLPTASASVKGGVKVGDGLKMVDDTLLLDVKTLDADIQHGDGTTWITRYTWYGLLIDSTHNKTIYDVINGKKILNVVGRPPVYDSAFIYAQLIAHEYGYILPIYINMNFDVPPGEKLKVKFLYLD